MSENDARARILEAVEALLTEGCPVGELTVRKIAARAGVGIGSVGYHFQSKDRLVYEVLTAQMTRLTRQLEPGERAAAPLERLRIFFRQTAELALEYSEIFRAQLAYDLLNGDLSICYYVTPLLKEHFGSARSELEMKILALQMISALQMMLLKMDEFQRYAGVSLRDAAQRAQVLEAVVHTAIDGRKEF
ncbi:hypothetical protein SDC9_168969 [bioreactor metagenome]|uniref:HTH tetR-type domain-containing protein n=1 Tax=bioreactor metagenome TaxID=1076179 RepID=A0A645G709_9ZZZZ